MKLFNLFSNSASVVSVLLMFAMLQPFEAQAGGVKRDHEHGSQGSSAKKARQDESISAAGASAQSQQTTPANQLHSVPSVVNGGVLTTPYLTRTEVKKLIRKAKKGNRATQDKLMEYSYSTGLLFDLSVTADDIGFFDWDDIEKRCYENDVYGYYASRSEAFKKFAHFFEKTKERADRGIAEAQNNLAYLYYNGLTPTKKSRENELKALDYLEKSAAQGNARALNLLGLIHEQGKGYTNDENNITFALRDYVEAADRGDVFAQYNIALLCLPTFDDFSDERAEIDLSLGFPYLLKAVTANKKPAQRLLSYLYLREDLQKIISRDPLEALRWALKSPDTSENLVLDPIIQLEEYTDVPEELGSFWKLVKETRKQVEESTHKYNTKFGPSHKYYKELFFEIPDPSSFYNEIAKTLKNANEILAAIQQTKPGFMITIVDLNDNLEKLFNFQKEPYFMSRATYKEITYLTLGEENVSTAKKYMEYLAGIEQEFLKADIALNKLIKLYKKPMKTSLLQARELVLCAHAESKKTETVNDLDALKPQTKKIAELLNKVVMHQENAKKIKEETQDIRTNLKADRKTLSKVKEQILDLIPKGLGRRNNDFMEEYPEIREK